MHAQRRDFVCRPLLILLSVIDFCTSDIRFPTDTPFWGVACHHRSYGRLLALPCSPLLSHTCSPILSHHWSPILHVLLPFFGCSRVGNDGLRAPSLFGAVSVRRISSPRHECSWAICSMPPVAVPFSSSRAPSLCPMSGVWTSGRTSLRVCLHWGNRNIFLSAMDFVCLGLPPLATAPSHGWSAVRPSSLLQIVAQARRPTPW